MSFIKNYLLNHIKFAIYLEIKKNTKGKSLFVEKNAN